MQDDIVYTEYSNLSKTIESMINKAFDDFKLLAVISGLFILLKEISGSYPTEYDIVFWGFILLFLIVAIIAFKNQIRRSFLSYSVEKIIEYENELRSKYQLPESLFRTYSDWEAWNLSTHRKIALIFGLLLGGALVVIPFILLLDNSTAVSTFDILKPYIYLSICFIVSIIFLVLEKKLSQ